VIELPAGLRKKYIILNPIIADVELEFIILNSDISHLFYIYHSFNYCLR